MLPRLTILSLFMLAACAVALLLSDSRPLSYDEGEILRIANRSLTGAWYENARYNSAPPLYVVVVWGYLKAGLPFQLARLVSWFALPCSIALMYRLMKTLRHADGLALLGAGLVASHMMLVSFAIDLREYLWTFALVLAWGIAFERTRRNPARVGALLALSTAGLWLQYSLVFVIGIGWLVLYRRLDRHQWIVGGAWLAANVALVVLSTTQYQMGRDVDQQAYLQVMMGWRNLIGGTVNMMNQAAGGAGLLVFPVLLLAGWRRLTGDWRLLVVGVWLAIMAASGMGRFPYGQRQAMGLLALVIVAGYIGLASLARTRPRTFAALVMVLWLGSVGTLATGTQWVVYQEGTIETAGR